MSITYRPSLTLAEIEQLLHLIHQNNRTPNNINCSSIQRKLEVFTLKAKHGITQPSHVRAGTPTLAAQLGMEEDTTIATLLDAFASNPSLLSAKQLERVQHHRYLNDLMTPDEEARYESTL